MRSRTPPRSSESELGPEPRNPATASLGPAWAECYPQWHPKLTRAAEEGGAELLAAALAAGDSRDGQIVYRSGRYSRNLHTDARLPDGTRADHLPHSPFPQHSLFGILPFAVWHGHTEVVRGLLATGVDVRATALVHTESYPRQWASTGLGLCHETAALPRGRGEGSLPDGHTHYVRVTALQVAMYKRDSVAAQLLLEAGAELAHPNLLDIIKPLPGSLFASKAGSWSPAAHFCFPPTFQAAAAELLRIGRKHGGVRAAGQAKWPFDCGMLTVLLLPALARDAADWLEVPSQAEWASGDSVLHWEGASSSGSSSYQLGEEGA